MGDTLAPWSTSNPAWICRTIDNRSAGATNPSYLAVLATLHASVPDRLLSPRQASANPRLCTTRGCDTACKLRFLVMVGNGVRWEAKSASAWPLTAATVALVPASPPPLLPLATPPTRHRARLQGFHRECFPSKASPGGNHPLVR